MHADALAGVAAFARQVAPVLTAEQLGQLGSAVKQLQAHPAGAHAVGDELAALYAANPQVKAALATPAGYAQTADVRRLAQKVARPRPAPAAKPRAAAAVGGNDPAVARQVAEIAGRRQAFDRFYADPEYQAMRAGARDDQLSEQFLAQRKALFGKRRRRRR